MIKTLEKRNFPVGRLTLLASARSVGKKLKFKGQEIVVTELTKDSFKGVDIALFSAGGSISKEFAPVAASAGCVVVDNSSAFRQDENVPLVVPEINAADVKWHKGIIANPNCTYGHHHLMASMLSHHTRAFGVVKRIFAPQSSAIRPFQRHGGEGDRRNWNARSERSSAGKDQVTRRKFIRILDRLQRVAAGGFRFCPPATPRKR